MHDFHPVSLRRLPAAFPIDGASNAVVRPASRMACDAAGTLLPPYTGYKIALSRTTGLGMLADSGPLMKRAGASCRQKSDLATKLALAEERSEDAYNRLQAVQCLLAQALSRPQPIQWDTLAQTPVWRSRDLQLLKDLCRRGDPGAVEAYVSMVLRQSPYPAEFPQAFHLGYCQASKTLRIEYRLPAPSELPCLLAVSYDAQKDGHKNLYVPATDHRRLHEECISQIALRTLHELFTADTERSIDRIVFRGASGPRWFCQSGGENTISLSLDFHQFSGLDLRSAAHTQTARQLVQDNAPACSKSDLPQRTAVNHWDTTEKQRPEKVNIAAIRWQDFEDLIRQVFEREFSPHGGTVTLTKASADGGVDVLIQDPDPIRGGKIVVQAKRYTNPVSVSAVRDLYGTLMNEGATKGILITTATFGAASYKFASDKPISLLNGEDFLTLMARHGIEGSLDLQAARNMRSA